MAERRPIVLNQGDLIELPSGSTISAYPPLVWENGNLRQLASNEDVSSFAPIVLVSQEWSELPIGDTLAGLGAPEEHTYSVYSFKTYCILKQPSQFIRSAKTYAIMTTT